MFIAGNLLNCRDIKILNPGRIAVDGGGGGSRTPGLVCTLFEWKSVVRAHVTPLHPPSKQHDEPKWMEVLKSTTRVANF